MITFLWKNQMRVSLVLLKLCPQFYELNLIRSGRFRQQNHRLAKAPARLVIDKGSEGQIFLTVEYPSNNSIKPAGDFVSVNI